MNRSVVPQVPLKVQQEIGRRSREASVTDYVIVLTTLSVSADAAVLARTLVEERLAACVNVLGEMGSWYRWKGVIEHDRERQVLLKTRRDRVPELEARLKQLHPYDVPEFVVLPIEDGGLAYLAWLGESLAR